MTTWESLKARAKAPCFLFNCTLDQAEYAASQLHALQVPVGKIKLNPYGYGQANQLIPVTEIEGLPRSEQCAYQIEVLGLEVIHMNAGLVMRTLASMGPFGPQMLLDQIRHILPPSEV